MKFSISAHGVKLSINAHGVKLSINDYFISFPFLWELVLNGL